MIFFLTYPLKKPFPPITSPKNEKKPRRFSLLALICWCPYEKKRREIYTYMRSCQKKRWELKTPHFEYFWSLQQISYLIWSCLIIIGFPLPHFPSFWRQKLIAPKNLRLNFSFLGWWSKNLPNPLLPSHPIIGLKFIYVVLLN